jgi:protein arginine N-methyltransferase 1
MGEYPAYDDAVYDAFGAADARHRAYRDAIQEAAPGRIVLDIGTGRDALWAIEAARAGARHVYAVEAHPAFAQAAAATIERAGLSGQVTVLPGLSTEQTLPVRAEVCISEIIGNVASAEGMIPALNDARSRLCAPDCVWIPFRAQTWMAGVDLSAAGNPVFATEALPYLDAIFATAGGPFDLRLCLAGPVDELLVSEPALVESLVFDQRRTPPAAAETTEVVLRLSPRAHADTTTGRGDVTGLLLWTRVAVTSHGRELDAISGDNRGWAPVYLPLNAAGVGSAPSTLADGQSRALGRRVSAGQRQREMPPASAKDRSTCTFTRRPSDDGIHPDYEITVDGSGTIRSPHHGGEFRATDLHRWLLDVSDPLQVS